MLFRSFPGFYVQPRTLRKYPLPVAAHLFGYIGEVDSATTRRDAYYKEGDYIGKSGIEQSYEPYLRGRRGVRVMMVDVFNREKGSFQNGRYDTTAIAGENLTISIDADLQALARWHEQLADHARSGRINDYYDTNLAIHEAIIDLADNRWLAQTIADLRKILKLSRQQQLHAKQYISQAALERALAQRDAAQAQVNALRAQTRAAQAQSGFFVLSAPYAGVEIGRAHV